MKKILVLLFVLFTLHASEMSPREKLLATIVHALVGSKTPCVYIDDKAWRSRIGPIEGIRMVDSCISADLVLTRDPEKIMATCPCVMLFMTTYGAYRSTPEAVGALFWQKGRPTLLFRHKVLMQRGLSLPATLHAYEE